MSFGSRIAVIPAGERWSSGTNRWALEDWLGAGAIISYLHGTCSPEAQAARNTFQSESDRCEAMLSASVSGRELLQRGYPDDVKLAAEVNVSSCAPLLENGAFRDWGGH
jgi:2-phosphosulfolactate phosphatase